MEIMITGSLNVEFDLMDLWEYSIKDLIEYNQSFCDVDILEVVEV